MGCEILADREGKPACGIKGKNDQHALARRVVRITDLCENLDVGDDVTITYANNKHGDLKVKVAVEQSNGEEYRCWDMRGLMASHREDAGTGKTRSYKRLRDFMAFAKRIGIKPVVLANVIIVKTP